MNVAHSILCCVYYSHDRLRLSEAVKEHEQRSVVSTALFFHCPAGLLLLFLQ
jgi:hypothetical protein